MRKDVLVFFIVVSAFILSHTWDKVKEIEEKLSKISSLERRISEKEREVRKFLRLKAESNQLFLTPREYALLLEKNIGICSFTSEKEGREGVLYYVKGKLDCYVPDYGSVRKIVRELKEKYPISIASYSYNKSGKFEAEIKVFGRQR